MRKRGHVPSALAAVGIAIILPWLPLAAASAEGQLEIAVQGSIELYNVTKLDLPLSSLAIEWPSDQTALEFIGNGRIMLVDAPYTLVRYKTSQGEKAYRYDEEATVLRDEYFSGRISTALVQNGTYLLFPEQESATIPMGERLSISPGGGRAFAGPPNPLRRIYEIENLGLAEPYTGFPVRATNSTTVTLEGPQKGIIWLGNATLPTGEVFRTGETRDDANSVDLQIAAKDLYHQIVVILVLSEGHSTISVGPSSLLTRTVSMTATLNGESSFVGVSGTMESPDLVRRLEGNLVRAWGNQTVSLQFAEGETRAIASGNFERVEQDGFVLFTATSPHGGLPIPAILSTAALLSALMYGAWKIGLFTRLRRDDLLDHQVRGNLADAIAATPWCTLANLQSATSCPKSTIRYHLRVLIGMGIVEKSVDISGTPRFQLRNSPRAALPDIQGPVGHEVLQVVGPVPIRFIEVVRKIGPARRTKGAVWKAAAKLEKDGFLRIERRGREVWLMHGPKMVRAKPVEAPM